MLERLRNKINEARFNYYSSALRNLLIDVLEEKGRIMAEATFVRRIDATLVLEEIRLIASSRGEESKAFTDCNLEVEDFGNESFGVSLIFNPAWIGNACKGRKQHDFIYEKMKAALKVVDGLRREGKKVLTCKEIDEMLEREDQ